MEGSRARTTGIDARGRCVVVTPETGGVPEQIPNTLAQALGHHDATVEHARSAYHAIVDIASHDDPERIALLIVEPKRHPRAEALALAAMTHAPDVAVWRYEPYDPSPVAPYVPHKPGVVPDPLVPDPDDEDEDDDDALRDAAPADHAPPATAGSPSPLRLAQTPIDTPEAPTPPPLVSSEELAMLLGHDPPGRSGTEDRP
jgi:hypothetical protein